jgi:hypothetical protein
VELARIAGGTLGPAPHLRSRGVSVVRSANCGRGHSPFIHLTLLLNDPHPPGSGATSAGFTQRARSRGARPGQEVRVDVAPLGGFTWNVRWCRLWLIYCLSVSFSRCGGRRGNRGLRVATVGWPVGALVRAGAGIFVDGCGKDDRCVRGRRMRGSQGGGTRKKAGWGARNPRSTGSSDI